MAKRKKRKPKRSVVGIPSDPRIILERAEGQLAEGNPKRAREGFRRLFKMDPDRYRDRYIEVTRLVIEERLSEGKPKDAGQLLAHLEEIGAKASQLGSLKIRVAAALGVGGASAELAAEAAAVLLESENAAERIEAADALVLARADQASAVCAGISHLCRSEWDQMKEALKEIGHRSPFAHWRLFLRGCAAYYRGDPDEAERCFARLPEGSVPARKSRAFGVLRGTVQTKDERTITEACLLSGEPKLAACLPAAEKKWRSERFIDAYRILKRSGATFPCLEVTPWGQLTRFFQYADCDMTGAQLDVWLEAMLAMLPPSGRERFNAESYLVSNALLRRMAGFGDPCRGEAFHDNLWPLFIACRENLLGSSARFVGMCHLLRAIHQEPDDGSSWYFSGRERLDFEPMIQTLKAAIEADPSFQDPPLKLLEIYRQLRRIPDANRLLDEMTKRFPDSKEVLLAAGKGCLDRKAYMKGLDYLERAREVDPVDPGIQAEIRRGLREKAAAHFRKGSESQLAKGRKTFEQLLASVPHHPAPGESRGFLLIQWSVLEEMTNGPNAPLAAEKFTEARQEVSPDVAQFYRAMQAQRLGASPRSGGRKSRKEFLPAPSSRKAQLPQAVQIFELWMRFEEDRSGGYCSAAKDWTSDYIKAATRKLRRNDRDLVLELVSLMRRDGYRWNALVADVIGKQLKQDPRDPHFLCLAWIHAGRPSPTKAQLQKAKDEAVKRRDLAALEAIKSFEKSQSEQAGPWGGDPFADSYDIVDEDDYLDDPDDAVGGLPDEMLEELIKLPHDQRVAELIGQGVGRASAEMASEVLEVLAQARRIAPDPPPRKRASSKNPPRHDANQFDLPF